MRYFLFTACTVSIAKSAFAAESELPAGSVEVWMRAFIPDASTSMLWPLSGITLSKPEPIRVFVPGTYGVQT